MTNEELCLRYQAGDPSAADELIEQCKDIVDSLAKAYAIKYEKLILTEEDYYQEGLIALLRAADNYDPKKEQFLHFVRRVIRNAFIDAIRKVYPHLHFVTYDDNKDSQDSEDAKEDDNNDDERIRMQIRTPYDASPERIYIQKENLQELHLAMNILSPRENQWIRWRYGFTDDEPHSLAESSKRYHLSESRAGKLEKRALGTMKKILKA